MKTTTKRWNMDLVFALIWLVLTAINVVKTAILIQAGNDPLSIDVAGNSVIALWFAFLSAAYLFKMRRACSAKSAEGNAHIQDNPSPDKAGA
ncbi:hypothetical protein RBE51_20950 [Pseudomonas taiwanensis]|uniref:hypothetical protein n=1 Tax=Pseudomonas taiwanensis TaxID=470150 RepID=UPI0028DF9E24|nr:hypothetical protein [Pseudomonas taiwanensis]MDT8925266.1 hypothetical protein [Pseudomonas taiwanensis]